MICADFDTFLLALPPPISMKGTYPPHISWCALPTHNIFLLFITEPTADAVEEMTPNQDMRHHLWFGDVAFALGLSALKPHAMVWAKAARCHG